MLTLYDAVTAENIPADAEYAAYYTDGRFANETAIRARCPHATLLSITVTPTVGADCCDCETGDLTAAQAEAWVRESLAAGHYRPVVYADASNWSSGLAAALEKYGSQIRRWVADYNDEPSIPSGYDAHQYSTGNVDTSVCADDFFAAKPKPEPKGHVRAIVTFDIATQKVLAVHGLPGTGVHFTGPEKWIDVHAQIQVGEPGGGHWRGA